MKANKNHLIGRTITAVDMRPFPDGRGGTAHDPVITLDNGRVLWFVVDETEVGEYGVCVYISVRAVGGKAHGTKSTKS